MRYAWTCAAYLVGVAESLAAVVEEEALHQAREDLRREWRVFEADQVGWAGYLMEGSLADGGEEELGGGGRTRLFVREGREIVRAVEWARGAVGEVVGGKGEEEE